MKQSHRLKIAHIKWRNHVVSCWAYKMVMLTRKIKQARRKRAMQAVKFPSGGWINERGPEMVVIGAGGHSAGRTAAMIMAGCCNSFPPIKFDKCPEPPINIKADMEKALAALGAASIDTSQQIKLFVESFNSYKQSIKYVKP